MKIPVRIGTRQSPLAMWQANAVANLLNEQNFQTEIMPITSDGDLHLEQPIYQLGITGVFTRSLDIALLNDQIDIAVHSLKDVPTLLPEDICLAGCLKRGNPYDILVYKQSDFYTKSRRKIATGSLRRSSFWLNQHPTDEMRNLRGNVQTRIKNLLDSDSDGAIFAYAGLERSGILENLSEEYALNYKILDDMIPATCQGIIGITAKKNFRLPEISDHETEICAKIEREFLNTLEGGCTAPIGAFAKIEKEKIHFKGAILSLDGKLKISVEEEFSIQDYQLKGKKLAEKCFEQGAGNLIKNIKIELQR